MCADGSHPADHIHHHGCYYIHHGCCNHPADHSHHDCCNHLADHSHHDCCNHLADHSHHHGCYCIHRDCCYIHHGYNHPADVADNRLGYHHYYCCNVDDNLPGYHHYYCKDDSHPAGVVDNCAVDVHFADLNQNLLDGIHHHCYNCDQSALNYKCADCEYVDAVCDFQFHDNCWNNFLMFVSSPHGCPHSVLLTDSEICFLILNPFF